MAIEFEDEDTAAKLMGHPFLAEHHPSYQLTVAWRYLTLAKASYEDAVRCLDAGYTSPSAARCDGLLPPEPPADPEAEPVSFESRTWTFNQTAEDEARVVDEYRASIPPRLKATPYVWKDPKTIPPRKYPAGYVWPSKWPKPKA